MEDQPGTALITGSLGGIGHLVVERLAARGHDLILVDLDADRLAEQASALPRARALVLDHTDPAAVRAFCTQHLAETRIDIAVLNAGLVAPGPYVERTSTEIERQLAVNLTAPALLLHALGIGMTRQGSGRLVVTVSLGGIVAMKDSAAYAASKFGLRGLVLSLRDEWAPQGVELSAVLPAGVDTPMLRYEARHGGSSLNFVGTPVGAEVAADAILGAIDRPRAEVYVPWADSLSARLLGAFPWMTRHLAPLLERLGERGRARYLARIADAP